MEFFLQIVLILVCLFYGARKGGVALGLLGGIGIVVLVFAFKLPPGKPPVDVMLTIVAPGRGLAEGAPENAKARGMSSSPCASETVVRIPPKRGRPWRAWRLAERSQGATGEATSPSYG